MLVLFDTPAGHALFKVLDTKKISAGNPDEIYSCFKDADSTRGMCAAPVATRPARACLPRPPLGAG